MMSNSWLYFAVAVLATTVVTLPAEDLPEGARDNGKHIVRFPKKPTTSTVAPSPEQEGRFSAELARHRAIRAKHNSTTISTKAFVANDDMDSAEAETKASMRIFLVFTAVGCCVLLVYVLERAKTHAIPDSVAIICFGGLLGSLLKSVGGGWERAEAFDPMTFFLYLLPPIILESGYSIQRATFFSNLGPILLFAVVGTAISTVVVGLGLYWLGKAGVVYSLSAIESFAFGSLISAVDPVATLAIFQALDMDRTLYMMVFGESVLNDAVSIVLTRSIIEIGVRHQLTTGLLYRVLEEFFLASLGSALIGVLFGLLGALLTKHLSLRQMPNIEFSLLCILAYLPYLLSEALDLSGIMAILFAGITHAHYTHYNLSPTTQVTAKQTFRTMAFLAETAVFLYIGMAIFSYKLEAKWNLIVFTIMLCLLGRAFNIFPLSAIVNGSSKGLLTARMQFIMWFSGLRGAIAFALAIHLPTTLFSHQTRNVLITTTLVVVLVTIVVFGCSTVPLLHCLRRRSDRRRGVRTLGLSRDATEPGASRTSTGMVEPRASTPHDWLSYADVKLFQPFFRRQVTRHDLRQAEQELKAIGTEWLSYYEDTPAADEHLRQRFNPVQDDDQDVEARMNLSDIPYASDGD
eukprot:TRINITY_DN10773_c0_g1_i4.p1 TRINITY_DN10773_c0_g1~~TRINITY_DN10773_c0_g1_i4.p1  ORF type:complete len:632 (+),score=128.32 TRINITY_DN10773_c0_g1_i4:96-1991(+)